MEKPCGDSTEERERGANTDPEDSIKELATNWEELAELDGSTGMQSPQQQPHNQPRDVIAHVLHNPDLAVAALLSRVAGLEEQVHRLGGPIYDLLLTPNQGNMGPYLQGEIRRIKAEACSILGELRRLASLHQASHTLGEVLHRVQVTQGALTTMRAMTELPTTHQDGGTPPRVRNPIPGSLPPPYTHASEVH